MLGRVEAKFITLSRRHCFFWKDRVYREKDGADRTVPFAVFGGLQKTVFHPSGELSMTVLEKPHVVCTNEMSLQDVARIFPYPYVTESMFDMAAIMIISAVSTL